MVTAKNSMIPMPGAGPGLKVFRILIRIMPGSIPNTMPIPTLPRHIQSHQETDV